MFQKSLLSVDEKQLHIIDLELTGNTCGLNGVIFPPPSHCVSLYHNIQNPKYFLTVSDLILALFLSGSQAQPVYQQLCAPL